MRMLFKYRPVLLAVGLLLLAVACSNSKKEEIDLNALPWEEIRKQASGANLNLMMWTGDPKINAYMNNYVVPEVKNRFDINLNIASGQGNTIVSILMTELQSGKSTSEIDMAWINGETFYQLRQIDALYGPFTQKLPNARYIDFENPFIGIDFQQPVNGFEMPWGNVQFTLIHDTLRTPNPPRNLNELEEFVQKYPGTFTIPTEFSGMTLLKSFLIELAGEDSLTGDFNERLYNKYSKQLWNKINTMKSDFWKSGETFPASLSAVHQMFVTGELYITMSNNDAEVDNKVMEDFFPESAKAYVLEPGTIQNSHYMGIVNHSGNKAAALVVANFLISPEAQYRKLNPEVWGDGTVLDINKLPETWQAKFKQTPNRNHAPPRSELQPYALQELAPEYMIRLYDDFRTYVVEE